MSIPDTFLNLTGLKKYTKNVLKLVQDSAVTYNAGDGVDIDTTNTINVESPVKGVYSQEDYNALPGNQKNHGLYVMNDGLKIIIDGTEVSISDAAVAEYNTDDGWHVRKFSDGYVEMISSDTITMAVEDWTLYGTGYAKDMGFTGKTFPLTLTVLYDIIPSLITVGHGYGAWLTLSAYSTSPLTFAPGYSIWRFTVPNASKVYTLKRLVLGRWK